MQALLDVAGEVQQVLYSLSPEGAGGEAMKEQTLVPLGIGGLRAVVEHENSGNYSACLYGEEGRCESVGLTQNEAVRGVVSGLILHLEHKQRLLLR